MSRKLEKKSLNENDGVAVVVADMIFSASPYFQIDQGDFNHAVTFERVQDQRVYFRDPYGVLRSMPEQQFPKFVMGVNAPRDLNI